MKSLISHFYTAACKFKVNRSDSQNFGEKNYREGVFRRFSVLYCPGTSFYTNHTRSSISTSFYTIHVIKRHSFGFELPYNLILDRSRILCNGIYVYLVCIYNYLFTYVMFMCIYSSVFYNL